MDAVTTSIYVFLACWSSFFGGKALSDLNKSKETRTRVCYGFVMLAHIGFGLYAIDKLTA